MPSPELVALLRCPETRQPVHVAPPEVISRAVREGRMRNGEKPANLDAGLLREDGRVLYPVRNGIPVMLVEEAMILPL